MPKITLLNSESGDEEEFEPVDAREILNAKDTIYTVPDKTREAIGQRYDPKSENINVPQLQGDPEMQTGLSIEKYGREAVVKAEVGAPRAAAVIRAEVERQATTTLGGPMTEEPVDSGMMTASQMREALSQRGIEYSATAHKSELKALLDKK